MYKYKTILIKWEKIYIGFPLCQMSTIDNEVGRLAGDDLLSMHNYQSSSSQHMTLCCGNSHVLLRITRIHSKYYHIVERRVDLTSQATSRRLKKKATDWVHDRK